MWKRWEIFCARCHRKDKGSTQSFSRFFIRPSRGMTEKQTKDDHHSQENMRTLYPYVAHYAPQTLSTVKYSSVFTKSHMTRLERMLYCSRMGHGEHPVGSENQVIVRDHCKDVPNHYDAVVKDIGYHFDWLDFRKGTTQEQLVSLKTEVADGWRRARRDAYFAQYEKSKSSWKHL